MTKAREPTESHFPSRLRGLVETKERRNTNIHGSLKLVKSSVTRTEKKYLKKVK